MVVFVLYNCGIMMSNFTKYEVSYSCKILDVSKSGF